MYSILKPDVGLDNFDLNIQSNGHFNLALFPRSAFPSQRKKLGSVKGTAMGVGGEKGQQSR